MIRSPKVTVTIPTFNSARSLSICLKALRTQTYPDIDISIVDSYSTDDTVSIAKKYDVSTINYYMGGLLGSRLQGISNAKGSYVLLLDSDQVLDKQSIARCVGLCESQRIDMVALEEDVYECANWLQWLFKMDRKVINTVNNLDPETGVILPRFFRKSILLKAARAIPPDIIDSVGGPDHAILYYESWKLSKNISVVKDAVHHMETKSLKQLIKKCYRWGFTGYTAKTVSKYSLLMKRKERFRGLLVASLASSMLLILKGIPYKIGYTVARIQGIFQVRTFLNGMFNRALALNSRNIYSMLEVNPKARLLDLGCFDGTLTTTLGRFLKTKLLYGIDIVPQALKAARRRGIIAKKGNLNTSFPYPDNYFDVIHANQVIEHIYDSDMFLSEIYRILKPGGYAVISTENASSWVNIIAGIMGWQIFSLTNISAKERGVGNPMAMFRHQKMKYDSFNHIRIYNYFGLKEYCEVMGFSVEDIKGAGYFPLPEQLGNIDKIHAHFISFKIRKK